MKSYWDFFFHSFNYRSEHTETCFIKESHTLFPVAPVKDCLLLEGSLFPARSLRAASDTKTAVPQDGVAELAGTALATDSHGSRVSPSPAPPPPAVRQAGEAGLQINCLGSDGAVMGTCQCHPPSCCGPWLTISPAAVGAAVLSNYVTVTCFWETHTSASKRGQQLFSRKPHPRTKQITKADGWACSHVPPWGCHPDQQHVGTAVSCMSWTLKMVQGEGDRGEPAPWQGVQAHSSSSSVPSPPPHLSAASHLCVSPCQESGGSRMRESPQLLAAAGQGGGGGMGTGPMRSRPLQCHLVPLTSARSSVPVVRPQLWECRGRRKGEDVFSLMCLEMCKLVVSEPAMLTSLDIYSRGTSKPLCSKPSVLQVSWASF